jgi:hypothetical protein
MNQPYQFNNDDMEELIMDLQTTADQLQPTWKKEMVNNGQRCTNCERFRKSKELGYVIRKHVHGYREAPARIKSCEEAKKLFKVPLTQTLILLY